VVNGTYSLARPLFFFTNGYPELGSHLQRFTSVHLTPQGEVLISKIGFVPRTAYVEYFKQLMNR
jgi:ABC-type phosphate transport system substrate-binding protein